MVRVTTAKPLTGYRLQVEFNDGTAGIYGVNPERKGGVFLRLLDPTVFQAVSINPDFGCVEWPGGIDLSPDCMRDEIVKAAAVGSNNALLLREEPPTK